MSRAILRLLLGCLLTVPLLATGTVHARTAQARIAKVTLAVATMTDVHVRLDWPAQSSQGSLELRAGRVEAPELGYRYSNVTWRCPLSRDRDRWRCEGDVRSGKSRPLRLALELDPVRTDIRLGQGNGALALQRLASAPDLTRIDLTRVPVAWAQALLAQAWPQGRLNAGTVTGWLDIAAPAKAPLHISGPLQLQSVAFDTADGTVAGENVGAQVDIDAELAATTRVGIEGQLHGGEMLFGNAYLALQKRRVDLSVQAVQDEGGGWQLPRLAWNDGGILRVDASAALDAQMDLRTLDLRAHSGNLAPLRDGYLTGFLGMAGLGELQLGGAADARLRIERGDLREADLTVASAVVDDPRGRFRFDGLEGDVRYSSTRTLESELRWQGGALHGLAFGAAHLPLRSADGVLHLRQPVSMPLLGGRAGFDHLQIKPPAGGSGLEIRFGLELEQLDVAQLSTALGWPAFTGQLTGHIPEARYANDRLDFEGGLAMQLFGGTVQVSSLAMERPFGVAPTLSSDIAFDDIDLESLTGVLGFGTITGKLDGRIADLRLVDWQPVAFSSYLQTDADAARAAGVRQRVSQRAVQDLSSVSDASFVSGLQTQLIGLFDDFGYREIGIACRLVDEVCEMEGLGLAGPGFIIVEGSGLPRLSVVGFNRRVDWPTLLERLVAASSGDVKPVFE
ncbi:hypothetical protein MNR01_05035 [Lysobacter sp. S4-A87]|uniref:hypothetical protein n=1 Tax=Lysobacter sp. S4-A87 TaxID=2925843 RepID=UPI001F531C7B|nr:hypothetical protein [Lysobacter sp. S4-A87]UNK50388.1 hypothetical protein MNR01_05035 [Lysobacter sp. S4-A87]